MCGDVTTDGLERRVVGHDLDIRKAKIVELLFFGGLTYDETAEIMKISPATVHRELKLAKAWLYRDLAERSHLR